MKVSCIGHLDRSNYPPGESEQKKLRLHAAGQIFIRINSQRVRFHSSASKRKNVVTDREVSYKLNPIRTKTCADKNLSGTV